MYLFISFIVVCFLLVGIIFLMLIKSKVERKNSKTGPIYYVKGHPYDSFRLETIEKVGLPKGSDYGLRSRRFYTLNPHDFVCSNPECKSKLEIGDKVWIYLNSGYYSPDDHRYYCLKCCPDKMTMARIAYHNPNLEEEDVLPEKE